MQGNGYISGELAVSEYASGEKIATLEVVAGGELFVEIGDVDNLKALILDAQSAIRKISGVDAVAYPTRKREDLVIANIHRGKDERQNFIYAELRDRWTGEMLVMATLDYILETFRERYLRGEK